jgi:NAD-dependent dihydropyrimidine dehydrogenase PreA subunit
MSANKTILICQCAERGLLDLTGIDEAAGLVVPDLCQAAQEKAQEFETLAAAEHPVIYACHPRAVKALFEFAGHPLPEHTEFINLRTPEPPRSHTSQIPNAVPAWFPLMDGDRCTNCGQCFEFCLFGVYEKDAKGRVRVANPQNCKNNCPACARICPAAAIIFPKVGESPINGAEIFDEDAVKANIKLNVDEILGDDIYVALNARKQKRQLLLNRKKVELALAERKNCSEKKG